MKTDSENNENVESDSAEVKAYFPEIYADVASLMKDKGIKEFRVKAAARNYSFDLSDVPRRDGSYMELRYGFSYPELPRDLTGKTFSHIFGSSHTGLEILFMEKRIRSPCWIEVVSPTLANAKVTWCKVELNVSGENSIAMLKTQPTPQPPPVSVAAISVKSVLNEKAKQNEIVAVGLLSNEAVFLDKPMQRNALVTNHCCFVSHPSDRVFPFDFPQKLKKQTITTIQVMSKEKALLDCLLAKLQRIDADVIVGHDLFGGDMDLLLKRIAHNKNKNWSRLSRLHRGVMPKQTGSKGAFFDALVGRVVCDAKIISRELVRCRSYDLTDLTQELLNESREEFTTDEISNAFNNSDDLLHLIVCTMADASFAFRVLNHLNALPLAVQITQITGGILSRTLLGGRSERNEFLLMHAFYEKEYICPEKAVKKMLPNNSNNKSATANVREEEDQEYNDAEDPETTVAAGSRKKPSYTGGLVLEPKKGFYDTFILLLDFNSLYPSIIQEFNICFTTLDQQPKVSTDESSDIILPELPDTRLKPGILPTEIRKLVESRKQVKSLMKQPNLSDDQYQQYNIRQLALKLTANSMYGCLGFSNSRFYAKPLAALVTAKGREILLHTKELVEKMGLEVIYGDTDSIMVNTNSREFADVMALGKKIKTEVNKQYRLLELDIDGVFKSMLLLKKKKYAALKLITYPDGKTDSVEEMKGLDIVRRDWSQLAKDIGRFVISQILSDKTRDAIVDAIHQNLIDLAEQIRKGKLPLEKFEIRKQLTHAPESYQDAKSQPHVQVALRYNADTKYTKQFKQGDTVPYIICDDGMNIAATQRAYHPQELRENESLKIDIHYYLASQVHPVVSRLCDPIEGTDSARIAECLGLDSAQYRRRIQVQAGSEEAELDVLGPCINFAHCEPFRFKCINPACFQLNEVFNKPYIANASNTLQLSLKQCSNSSCSFEPINAIPVLCNALQLQIRQYMNKYYQMWFACSDPMCNFRTRQMPLQLDRQTAQPLCPVCCENKHENETTMNLEYTESMLFAQLSYFQRAFDLDAAPLFLEQKDRKLPPVSERERKCYEELKKLVDDWLFHNAYSEVNLTKLFEFLTLPHKNNA